MPVLLSALVALVLLTVPSAAMAQSPATNAPPGNSAIDEYLETVPGATGSQRPGPPAAGGESAATPLTAAQRARLERAGPDGKALAAIVDATSAAKAPRTRKPAAATADGRSPVPAVIGAAAGDNDGGGMGIALPAILLASLVGAIAIVVVRRRRASS